MSPADRNAYFSLSLCSAKALSEEGEGPKEQLQLLLLLLPFSLHTGAPHAENEGLALSRPAGCSGLTAWGQLEPALRPEAPACLKISPCSDRRNGQALSYGKPQALFSGGALTCWEMGHPFFLLLIKKVPGSISCFPESSVHYADHQPSSFPHGQMRPLSYLFLSFEVLEARHWTPSTTSSFISNF